MGFVRRPVFRDMKFVGELDGLEVRVRGLSGHGWVKYSATDATADSPLSAVDLFVEQVDRWNLEHEDGGSVPVTFDAFMDHDLEFIKAVTGAWVREVVPLPHPTQQQLSIADQAAHVPEPEPEPDLSMLAAHSQPLTPEVPETPAA